MSKAKQKAAPAKVKADKITKKASQPEVKKPRDRLHSLNKWLAVAYGVQALALLLFSLGGLFPVTIHFLGVDTLVSQATQHTAYATASRHLFDVSLPLILAMSLAVSAALHGILARWLRSRYDTWIAEGSNPIRWLDGAFSASLLPVAIGLVAGLSDITSLAMLFVLGFATHILGLYMEAYNQKQRAGGQPSKDYRPFVLLSITGATTWLILGATVLAAIVFGNGLPPGVWIAYLTGIICVAVYVYVMIQGYKRQGRWADYRTGEAACVIISFIAKSAIAWLLFSAVLTR